MCLCTLYMSVPVWLDERVRSLELELHVVMSCHVVLGPESRPSIRTESAHY